MTNLDHELHQLAPFVELPPERDLAPAVRARMGARRPRPGRLVLALSLLVVAVAVAFAVPPARKRQSARYAFTKPSCAASSASAAFPATSHAVRKAMPWYMRTSSS